jgi:hypothetical protein
VNERLVIGTDTDTGVPLTGVATTVNAVTGGYAAGALKVPANAPSVGASALMVGAPGFQPTVNAPEASIVTADAHHLSSPPDAAVS